MEEVIIKIAVALVFLAIVIFAFIKRKTGVSSKGMAGSFTNDLTAEAKLGKLDKIIGRDKEVERIIHILLRRKKNNPILLGEPGVGKTAIIEGLAQNIINEKIPGALKNKTILALDLNKLMAGTQFRGELENRLQNVLTQIQNEKSNVILFIDEIHLLQQLGKSEGAMSISDVIKPILANGKLQIIGATTWKEYNEYIKPDEAFDRRMQPVFVDEPDQKTAMAMLKGLKSLYETYHKVKITDKAIEAAVKLSDKKINHRYLPDKALDLIDEACAKAAIDAENAHMVPLGVVHTASKQSKNTVDVDDIQVVIDQWLIHNKEDARRDARKK